MKGLGAFQMAQMKHSDARVFALCHHLRAAIDLLEQIASEPFRSRETPAEPPPPKPLPLTPLELPPHKLTYNLKEAAAALGVGRSSLYKALAEGRLKAIKLGNRTLIPADELRRWVAAQPPRS